jgi:hypothetical protein
MWQIMYHNHTLSLHLLLKPTHIPHRLLRKMHLNITRIIPQLSLIPVIPHLLGLALLPIKLLIGLMLELGVLLMQQPADECFSVDLGDAVEAVVMEALLQLAEAVDVDVVVLVEVVGGLLEGSGAL